MFSKTLREICLNTGFLWSVFSHIWTESYPYFKLPNAWNGIIDGLFPRSQKFSYFRQIVNDVNIELSNICYLYQILFLKPNDNWLHTNEKFNHQLFWNDDLHLSKTGYLNFATSLFNFILSCHTSKSTSFYLRKIEK